MLHHRQKLHVGESHLPHVIGQRRGDFRIRQKAVAVRRHPAPGAQMHLVDRQRGSAGRPLPACGHPRRVLPPVIQVPDDGGGLRRQLVIMGKGIGLFDQVAVVHRLDAILVDRSSFEPRDEPLPYARGLQRLQRMGGSVPSVEISGHGYATRIGRPYRKMDAGG